MPSSEDGCAVLQGVGIDGRNITHQHPWKGWWWMWGGRGAGGVVVGGSGGGSPGRAVPGGHPPLPVHGGI